MSYKTSNRYSSFSYNSSDITFIGNRCIQYADGRIETVLKTPAEVFGEYAIRPIIKRANRIVTSVDRVISSLFNFIPVAKADQILEEKKEVTCRDPEEILKEKLSNPNKKLSNVESIALLSHCIYKGEVQAKKALGKRAVVFLGNTGSAKSTTINYLFGLAMKKVKPKDVGLAGLNKIVIVDPNGEANEVMLIGHQITRSKTFMPQVEVDEKNSITYVDCPGFLDDRGAEINIANAVNIKKVIKNCDTVKFVILINYHSLVADRTSAIRQLIKIFHNLFSSEESFLKHKNSMYIGITLAPKNFDIENFKEVIFKEVPSLKPFSDRFFSYDPLDEYRKGFWTREEFIKKIKQLVPIKRKDSADLFKTVLTPEDENALAKICESVNENMITYMKNKDIKHALSQLELLDSLKDINHPIVYKLLEKSNMDFVGVIKSFTRDFELHCVKSEFESAQKVLDFLSDSEELIISRMKDVFSIDDLKKLLEKAKQEHQDLENFKKDAEHLRYLRKTRGKKSFLRDGFNYIAGSKTCKSKWRNDLIKLFCHLLPFRASKWFNVWSEIFARKRGC